MLLETVLTLVKTYVCGYAVKFKKRIATGVSIGRAAFKALEGSPTGQIHSVFERAFNLLIDGRLVGVVRSDVPICPINLVTDIPSTETMPSWGIKKGLRAKISGNHFFVEDVLEISLDGAKIWHPPTRVEKPLRKEQIEQNLEAVKKGALSRAGDEGLGPLLPCLDSIIKLEMPVVKELNGAAKTALPHLLSLLKSVKSGNVNGVSSASKKLVGLGPGLSPSADDMLAGFTSALWWFSNSFGKEINHVREINNAIASCADATNLLSRQLLEHAASGEVSEHLVAFFEELLSGSGKSLGELVSKVMEMGETSGEDTMVGLILGAELGLENFRHKR